MFARSRKECFHTKNTVPVLINDPSLKFLKSLQHRLNMELDLQIYLGSCIQLYSLAETQRVPTPLPLHVATVGII